MDSINKIQPEKNHQDLFYREASEKIRELGEKAKTSFFFTDLRTGAAFSTGPMAVQKYCNDGTLYFLSASDSHKNRHTEQDHLFSCVLRVPIIRVFSPCLEKQP